MMFWPQQTESIEGIVMRILIILALVAALLTWYALWGREWFKTTSWGARFLTWIEPVEIFLYKKSETILFGRTLQGLGYLLTALQQLAGVDFTPILPFVPDQYKGYVNAAVGALPLLISGLGAIVERLRNTTTAPIQIVSLPEKVISENPKVAEAVAVAEVAKVEAVAAVAEAKAA